MYTRAKEDELLRRIKDNIYDGVNVKVVKGKGYGVFTTHTLKKVEYIVLYS